MLIEAQELNTERINERNYIMGRPLRKQNFGNTGDAGAQLQVHADIGAGEELCWVQDQPGSRTYTVASVAGGATPLRTGRVTLQAGAITAEGQARLVVTPFGGGTEYARTLLQHTVKTWSDNTYTWKLGVAAAATGEATVAYA